MHAVPSPLLACVELQHEVMQTCDCEALAVNGSEPRQLGWVQVRPIRANAQYAHAANLT